MAYKIGDKIHVDFIGTVGEFEPNLNATCKVAEANNGWTHYLYILSPGSTDTGVTGDRKIGTTVRAEFDAKITGEVKEEKYNTTQVQELLPGGRTGLIHYLFLDSPAITALEEEEPPQVVQAPLRYKANDKVHVSMDVIVRENSAGNSALALTTRVRETTGEQWVHFLYLGSRSLQAAGKAVGETVHVEFDAQVDEDAPTGPEGTTRIYELDENGRRRSLHYLFLPSDSVTGPDIIKQPGTGQQRRGTAVAYKIGTKVHVDIRGITGAYEPALSATNEVREADGSWTHFLYLSSDKVSGGSEPGSLRTAGFPVRAEFDAEIIGLRAENKFGTTKVRELNENDRNASSYGNYVHYLFLNSDSVTELADEPAEPEPAVPKAPVAYAKGDMIRVNFTGRVSDPRITGAGACSRVVQVTGDARNHFLYLSSSLITGNTTPGGLVSATFNAVITGEILGGATEVRELRAPGDGSTRFFHFISLDSDAVTLLEAASSRPTVTSKSAVVKGSTMSIDQYNATIDDGDVDRRIEDLESEQGYEVVRVRNDEVLADYDNEDEAEQYIQDEDYDTARVIVREKELDDDDQIELNSLRALRDDLGGESITYTLYNESFFDGDWAREQAVEEGFSRSQLSEWPLDLLDWEGDVVTERRDALYPNEVEFDGTTFYYDEG